eukprot:Lithocolla_globosa_v1_NODE_1275_length_2706_cov_15.149755.p1 type:complete len:474 gc:universal NODE_1275_length_2706_cov_15.149755:1631-210(-)
MVQEIWLGLTRKAEKLRDMIHNPFDRDDETLYAKHFLEMTRDEMLAIGLKKGIEKFGDYFHFSGTQFRLVEPWQIRDPEREECLCRYHLQFEYIAVGLHEYRKYLKTGDKLCGCERANPRGAYNLRKFLLCPRLEQEGVRRLFDSRDCILRTCPSCGPNLSKLRQSLCEHERAADGGDQFLISFFRWQNVDYTKKDGDVVKKYDFVKSKISFSQFLAEFEDFFPDFIFHHDLARWQDEDYSDQPRNMLPGFAMKIADFSENYKHLHRLEHQSKYFHEMCSSLFPNVVRLHLDDVQNISTKEKEKLRQLFDKYNLPHIISESHIVISPDLNHLTANVIHFDDNLFVPYLKSSAPTVHTLLDRSDGATSQFKGAKHFLHISSFESKHNLHCIHSFSGTGHGKAECDPEGGVLKSAARRYEMKSTPAVPTTLPTARDLFDFAVKNLTTPKESLFEKKGREFIDVSFTLFLRVVQGL